ncbi:MAG: hypothetical protein ACHREM_03910 [Polyangiales bacterium]
MTPIRALAFFCVPVAIGSLSACAQLLGGPFDPIDDASVDAEDTGARPDVGVESAPFDVGRDSSSSDVIALDTLPPGIDADTGVDSGVDVPPDSGVDGSSTCTSTGCDNNSLCTEVCAPIVGRSACCALTPGTTSGLCVYSTTACGSQPLCAGCWQGGICELGTVPTACGNAGIACQVCPFVCGANGAAGCTSSVPVYEPACDAGVCSAGIFEGCCSLTCTAKSGC